MNFQLQIRANCVLTRGHSGCRKTGEMIFITGNSGLAYVSIYFNRR